MNKKNTLTVILAFFFIISGVLHFRADAPPTTELVAIQDAEADNVALATNAHVPKKLYEVTKVVDGDTIDVSIGGSIERLRLIGVNTPEAVDPRKTVECFGVEASNYAKLLLEGKQVSLETDPSQGERDKYGRLLRYAYLPNGMSINLHMIKGGYAHEYTYDIPYKYQAEFKSAEKLARESKAGLWGSKCQGFSSSVNSESKVKTTTSATSTEGANGCTIKGNINTKGEKIFHLKTCGSYNNTVISESQGERWFCSEDEARAAGWRKAGNCN